MKASGGRRSSLAVIVSITLLASAWGAYAQEPATPLWIRLGTSDGDRIAKIEGNKLWLSRTAKDMDRQPALLAKSPPLKFIEKAKTWSVLRDIWVFPCTVPPQSKEASAGISATEIEIIRYHRSDSTPEVITCYHRWKIPGTGGNTWVYEKEECHKVTPDLAFPYHAPSSLKLVTCHFRIDSSPEFFGLVIQVGIRDSATAEFFRVFQSVPTTNWKGEPQPAKQDCEAQFRFLRANGTQVNLKEGFDQKGKVTYSHGPAQDRNQPGGPYASECIVYDLPPGTYTATITYDIGPLAGVLKAEEKFTFPHPPFGPIPPHKKVSSWQEITGYKPD